MKQAIQCKYSCFKCGIHRQIVTVAAREEEEVDTWLMKICAPALSADHDRRSPACRITQLSEVMIPIEGAEKIGGPAVQPSGNDPSKLTR
jgi:hypothetical protein